MTNAAGPSVAVAIVTWNTSSAALAAAEAFAGSAGVRPEVTVIDNASDESERDLLRNAGDSVRVRLEERNLGYAAAANLALSDARTDAVCVTNADVKPHADMLRTLTDAVLADERIGIAAPNLGERGNAYHRRLPGASTLLVRAFLGSFGAAWAPGSLDGTPIEVDQPGGACFVMRTALWRELGGFDPGFFLWYEDVDLAKRAVDAGLRNVVVTSAHAKHDEGVATARLDPVAHQAIRLRSLRRYVAKHHPRLLPAQRAAISTAAVFRGAHLRGWRGARELLQGVRTG